MSKSLRRLLVILLMSDAITQINLQLSSFLQFQSPIVDPDSLWGQALNGTALGARAKRLVFPVRKRFIPNRTALIQPG